MLEGGLHDLAPDSNIGFKHRVDTPQPESENQSKPKTCDAPSRSLRFTPSMENDFELAHFFAWARSRAYAEFEARLAADPQLDPNWTFSDIMQRLLDEFRLLQLKGSVDPPEPNLHAPAEGSAED